MSESEPNPYAPPQVPQEAAAAPRPLSADEVRRRLAVPAYGILASVGLNVIVLVWQIGVLLWALVRGDAVNAISWAWLLIMFATIAVINLHAALGARAMLRLEDYRAALRGAWFAIVPCNVGCLVALPFALYADWLLRDPRVHAAFSPRRITLLARPA